MKIAWTLIAAVAFSSLGAAIHSAPTPLHRQLLAESGEKDDDDKDDDKDDDEDDDEDSLIQATVGKQAARQLAGSGKKDDDKRKNRPFSDLVV
jgi:hypothetical protein